MTDGWVYLENVTETWGAGGEERGRQVPERPRAALGGGAVRLSVASDLWPWSVVSVDIVQRESGVRSQQRNTSGSRWPHTGD